MVDVMALWLQHVLKMCLVVNMDMFSLEYLEPNKSFFASVELHGDHMTVTKFNLI